MSRRARTAVVEATITSEPRIAAIADARPEKALVAVQRELSEAARAGRPVIFILGPRQALDSRVLAVLHGAARRARRESRYLALVCPHPDQRRLLDLLGLAKTLRVAPSVEAARDACSGFDGRGGDE